MQPSGERRHRSQPRSSPAQQPPQQPPQQAAGTRLLCSASAPMVWLVPGRVSDQSLLVSSLTARPVM